MAKRYIDTGFFKSEFVRDLTGPQKLLYAYIICECSNGGFWSKDLQAASLYTGFALAESDFSFFIESGRAVLMEGRKYFFPDFMDHQYPNGISESNPAHKQIFSELKKYNLIDENNQVKKGLGRDSGGTREGLGSPFESKNKDSIRDNEGTYSPTQVPSEGTKGMVMDTGRGNGTGMGAVTGTVEAEGTPGSLKAAKPSASKSIQQTNQTLYQKLTDSWFEWYERRYGFKPKFSATDGAKVKSIQKYLSDLSKQRGATEDDAVDVWIAALEAIQYHDWVAQNVSLPIIESKLNELIAISINGTASIKKNRLDTMANESIDLINKLNREADERIGQLA